MDFAHHRGRAGGLDRLEKAGYINREFNPSDRWSFHCASCNPQMARIKALYRSRGRQLAAALSDYDDRELRLILDFLDKVNRSPE